jgi:hypothetical protein
MVITNIIIFILIFFIFFFNFFSIFFHFFYFLQAYPSNVHFQIPKHTCEFSVEQPSSKESSSSVVSEPSSFSPFLGFYMSETQHESSGIYVYVYGYICVFICYTYLHINICINAH